MSPAKLVRWVVAAVLLASTAWLNVTHLVEAYGAGPPYYGRTTNMDKWENPVPELVVVDLVIVAVVAALVAPALLRQVFARAHERR